MEESEEKTQREGVRGYSSLEVETASTSQGSHCGMKDGLEDEGPVDHPKNLHLNTDGS